MTLSKDQIKLIHIEDTKKYLIQMFNQTLESKAKRRNEIERLYFVPVTHFSKISFECSDLYGDGYFYACISLCQTLGEALSRFICEEYKNKHSGFVISEIHSTRINALKKKNVITKIIYDCFETLHKQRNDFHHLNNTVNTSVSSLQAKAKKSLELLSQIERFIFGSSIQDGCIVPDKPEYWKKF